MNLIDARLDPEVLAGLQQFLEDPEGAFPQAPPNPAVERVDLRLPGLGDDPEIPARLYRPTHQSTEPRAALLWIHGGGFVSGTHEELPRLWEHIVESTGGVVISVGYRLAPEHPFPAALHDCYAALAWIASQSHDLHIDPQRISVAGGSAGGCLAASVALMARDQNGPSIHHQLLLVPMTDDRAGSPSSQEVTDPRIFNREGQLAAWNAYLGSSRETVPLGAVPARAQDLANLPPAFVMVEDLDPLRDEGIAYAARLMQAGVPTELHMYPGTFHGSMIMAPEAVVSQREMEQWFAVLHRVLS